MNGSVQTAQNLPAIDTDHAVQIADNVFWTGYYMEDEALHCNPYLIRNGAESILIDPGSVPDFPVVGRKLFSVIEPQSVSTIILNHQDPDLCASVPIFESLRENYDYDVVAHRKTIYLLKHYGIKGKFHRLDDGETDYRTPGGRELRFITTPFAHFAGAVMTYDVKSRVLFTGDILGGVGTDWELYHTETALANMKAFMQGFIPSNRALRYALLKIQNCGADLFAPQHGQIIRKDQLPAIIEALWNLPCGLDLISDELMKKAAVDPV